MLTLIQHLYKRDKCLTYLILSMHRRADVGPPTDTFLTTNAYWLLSSTWLVTCTPPSFPSEKC